MKIVTFNLRMDTKHDGVNYFFNRAPYILAKLRSESPDIICFQEATDNIRPWLEANLTEYTVVGTGRSSERRDARNPIAFKKDMFSLFGLTQFWLSPTPYVPGSRYDDQSTCPRICTKAELRIKDTPKIFRVYNTHLDHIGENARLLGMNSILAKIAEDNDAVKTDFIITGDMNAEPDEASMKAVTGFARYRINDLTKGIKCTFHDFGKIDNNKIDYIFASENIECGKVTVWNDRYGDFFLTDHYPVAAEITLG